MCGDKLINLWANVRHLNKLVALLLLILFINGCGNDSKPTKPEPEPCSVMIDDSPVWSPDGSTIAYRHYGITTISDDSCEATWYNPNLDGIWLVDSSGANPRLLVQGGDYPAWSADSTWIVFERRFIWKIKTNGDSLTQLTFRRSFWEPDVAPNNDKVAFYNSITDSFGIWITDFGGKDSLFYWGMGGGGPRWHFSGDSLFYSNARTGYWIESLDRSGKRKIHGPLGFYSAKMDFNRIIGRIVTESDGRIYTFTIGGTELRQLTSGRTAMPSWAPDGSKIVYVGLTKNKLATIWIMNSDGTNGRPITFWP